MFRAAISGRAGRRRGHRQMTGLQRAAGDPAAVARPRRTGSGGVPARGRPRSGPAQQGMNLHELDAAHRGHGRAVRAAPARADRALPRGVGGGRLRARAADLGEPQRHPARPTDDDRRLLRHRRRRDVSDQIGHLDGGIARFGRQLHRRAGRRSPRSSAATRPSARPTRCCSPCPTSSACALQRPPAAVDRRARRSRDILSRRRRDWRLGWSNHRGATGSQPPRAWAPSAPRDRGALPP